MLCADCRRNQRLDDVHPVLAKLRIDAARRRSMLPAGARCAAAPPCMQARAAPPIPGDWSNPSKGKPMSTTRDIAVIVGSLRKDSINRKVAHALSELAPAQ